jgi:hypothetical protein
MSTIQPYQLIRLAAESYFRSVVYGPYAVSGLHALYEASSVRRGIHKINTGLIEGHGVKGRENADVVHIRLCGVAVTIAVNGQAVHHVDVKNFAV